jgi:hypothetical protein
MVHTQKVNGSFHTVMSCFGVSRWDEAIYIPAGLSLEGNSSARFYEFGEYPENRDRYMRHLVFSTPESPDIYNLANTGRALIQLFEIAESHSQIEELQIKQIQFGQVASNASVTIQRVHK